LLNIRKEILPSGVPVKDAAYGAIVFIKAGTLDDASWLAPNMHIWCAEKLPWVGIPEGATQAPANPS
jgi:hypothetical protein